MPLIKSPAVSRDTAAGIVSGAKWFHRIEVLPGLVTPGRVPTAPAVHNTTKYMDGFGIPKDLSGRKVLDIGAYDGPMSFELAQRGAAVTAVDIKSPDATGFNALKTISGIEIPHVRTNVYELKTHFGAEFDLVLFLGVFYHLEHPILAFENVAHVLKPNGIVYFEGASFGSYMEDIDGAPISDDVSSALDALDRLDKLGVPVCLSYPGTYLNGNNWFLPNTSTLRGWAKAAKLQVENIYVRSNPNGRRRIGGRARKA